jgi:hypothetical protein
VGTGPSLSAGAGGCYAFLLCIDPRGKPTGRLSFLKNVSHRAERHAKVSLAALTFRAVNEKKSFDKATAS